MNVTHDMSVLSLITNASVLVQLVITILRAAVEAERVLEARAAPALHEHAQLQVGIAFFGHQFSDLAGSRVKVRFGIPTRRLQTDQDMGNRRAPRHIAN